MSVESTQIRQRALVLDGERRFRRSITAAIAAGAVLLVALLGASLVLFQVNRDYSRWVDHTYAAETKIGGLATNAEKLETVRRGYLLRPDETFWTTYLETRDRIGPDLDDLARFTSDNPVQRANVAALRPLLAAKLEQMRATIEVAHAGGLQAARETYFVQSTLRVTQRIRKQLADMDAEERRLLQTRAGDERGASLALLTCTLAAAVLLIVLAVGVGLLVRRYADDLKRSELQLRALNEGLEDAVRERTADLTRANDEIQRFAYIVSHDLRSPLVNIMGFTSEMETSLPALHRLLATVGERAPELLTKEARLVVEEEIPEAVGFIRTSTRKMDRLINAILKLSREGRRTLSSEPLDLTLLAGGVADSLRQLAGGRGAEVVVEPGLPALNSDRVAVEQVLSNLVENAVKYLSPDRPGRVVVRGREADGRVLVEVEDNGRGIALKDHERIFELFRRSGVQDQPGEGIGLAHVRALVYRLGGTIDVRSELGRGAVFRVSLPRTSPRDEGQAA